MLRVLTLHQPRPLVEGERMQHASLWVFFASMRSCGLSNVARLGTDKVPGASPLHARIETPQLAGRVGGFSRWFPRARACKLSEQDSPRALVCAWASWCASWEVATEARRCRALPSVLSIE